MKSKMPGMFPVFPKQKSKLSGNKTEKILVEQRCENCKNHIEKTALSLEGINKAIWDEATNMLILNFDPSKINLDDVEVAIASAGHNTPNHKAKVEFYTVAPKCCNSVDKREEEWV